MPLPDEGLRVGGKGVERVARLVEQRHDVVDEPTAFMKMNGRPR